MHTPRAPLDRPRAPLALIVAAGILALLLIGALLAWMFWQWSILEDHSPWFADTIRYALALGGALLALIYGALFALGAYNRWAGRAPAFADKEIRLMQAKMQPAPNAQTFTYSPRSEQITAEPPAQLALPAPDLPGAVDLATLDYRPTANHILLGLDELGQITVSIPDMCHVALLGSTGGGKSNLLRLLIPQLQAVGAKVVLADPHYAPLDPDTGEDWQPISDRLIHPPAISAAQIDQELSFMLDELARRLEKRNKGEKVGDPLFFAFDELPVIADLVKDAPARLGKLLREGRKVQLLTVGASQSLLIKEIGGSSALRDQYRTGFYVGGDRKSAAAILDMPERDIDDGPLGKGIVLLRSKSTQPARLVRVPMVSNEALYRLLSTPQIAPTTPLGQGSAPVPFGFQPPTKAAIGNPSGTQTEPIGNPAEPSPGAENLTSGEIARILAFFYEDGLDPPEIIRRLWPTLSKGRATQERTRSIWAIIRATRGKK